MAMDLFPFTDADSVSGLEEVCMEFKLNEVKTSYEISQPASQNK
jgi:hypothetical protein